MKNYKAGFGWWALVSTICFVSCTKNNSKFYGDEMADGLAIFSNTGNNVMSCYINGKAWQTQPRITTITPIIIGSGTNYELFLYRYPMANNTEIVNINWQGYYQSDRSLLGSVNLQLTIPRNSFQRYLRSLQGQRLSIDSSAGNYFTAPINQSLPTYLKGNGTIYFETLQIDSIAPGVFTGKLSGIFQADFGLGTITKGRFDHVLTQQQIR